jgi:hypothetical protein
MQRILETAYVSISGWIDKENMVFIYNGVLLSQNEILFVRKWMELEIIMLSKINQFHKDKNCTFSLICGR